MLLSVHRFLVVGMGRCPRCWTRTDSNQHFCAKCGLNIRMATLISVILAASLLYVIQHWLLTVTDAAVLSITSLYIFLSAAVVATLVFFVVVWVFWRFSIASTKGAANAHKIPAVGSSQGMVPARNAPVSGLLAAGMGLSAIILLGLGIFFVAICGGALIIFGNSVSPLVTEVLVIGLIFGLICLAGSFSLRHRLTNSRNPASSTALALYIAIEFLAGAFLVFVGGANMVSGGFWAPIAIALLGLLLVSDCVLLYRREFTQRTVRPSKVVEPGEGKG